MGLVVGRAGGGRWGWWWVGLLMDGAGGGWGWWRAWHVWEKSKN